MRPRPPQYHYYASVDLCIILKTFLNGSTDKVSLICLLVFSFLPNLLSLYYLAADKPSLSYISVLHHCQQGKGGAPWFYMWYSSLLSTAAQPSFGADVFGSSPCSCTCQTHKESPSVLLGASRQDLPLLLRMSQFRHSSQSLGSIDGANKLSDGPFCSSDPTAWYLRC